MQQMRQPNVGVAASMQASQFQGPGILSDHVSVGGKSQLHHRTTNMQ